MPRCGAFDRRAADVEELCAALELKRVIGSVPQNEVSSVTPEAATISSAAMSAANSGETLAPATATVIVQAIGKAKERTTERS